MHHHDENVLITATLAGRINPRLMLTSESKQGLYSWPEGYQVRNRMCVRVVDSFSEVIGRTIGGFGQPSSSVGSSGSRPDGLL